MPDNQDTIIIRRAADSPTITIDQRAFLLDIAAVLDSGGTVDMITRWQVTRLLGKAVFG